MRIVCAKVHGRDPCDRDQYVSEDFLGSGSEYQGFMETPAGKKKIRKDLEKQLEIFNKIYDEFINDGNYKTTQEARITKIAFKDGLKKSLIYYSFLKLI